MRRYTQQDDEDLGLITKQRTPIISSPIGIKHEFYLTGEILEPEMYLEWFHTIRNANENDLIIIYLNCPGGNASTAIQFLSVLDDCDGEVMVQVEGMCASAATMIFMKAHGFSIAPHSEFLFHNYSGGAIGKGGEIKEKVVHQSKWAEKLLRDTYQHFFTETEIQQILDGKDFWMDGDEVVERMEKRLETYKKEYEEKQKKEEEKIEEEKKCEEGIEKPKKKKPFLPERAKKKE